MEEAERKRGGGRKNEREEGKGYTRHGMTNETRLIPQSSVSTRLREGDQFVTAKGLKKTGQAKKGWGEGAWL